MSGKRQPEDISIEALAQFKYYIRFVSCDPAKNRSRFYLLSWQPALDGSAALVYTWGRIGTQGHSRAIFYLEQANAQGVTRVSFSGACSVATRSLSGDN